MLRGASHEEKQIEKKARKKKRKEE